jgi:hypothetical protein
MRSRFVMLVCLPMMMLAASAAQAIPLNRAAAAIARVVGDCSNPCTIQSNNGGVIVDYEAAGNAIRAGARRKLVINGFCASACMVMADRARPRACITSSAVFAYHKTNYNRPIPLSGDLRNWIVRHGGFPEFHGTPGIMSNVVARKFWPLCSQASL